MPPIKTLRKGLSGVYRADGFSGPTRRYVLIVAMLVGLASLPTLAAITAGSNELDEGSPGALDAPFLPPASSGALPPTAAPAADGGIAQGEVHARKAKPDHPRYARSAPPSKDDPTPSHHTHQHRKVDRSQVERRTMRQFVRSVVRNRSADRSEITRRATVAERPQNVRPARIAERTHNSRRLQAESRPEDGQSANRSYRGSHRAERHHCAEDSRANRRNSGSDRHQPEHSGHR